MRPVCNVPAFFWRSSHSGRIACSLLATSVAIVPASLTAITLLPDRLEGDKWLEKPLPYAPRRKWFHQSPPTPRPAFRSTEFLISFWKIRCGGNLSGRDALRRGVGLRSNAERGEILPAWPR